MSEVEQPQNPRLKKRAVEAREELSSALGRFRLEHRNGDDDDCTGIELAIQKALDRLDRILHGEDYIARWKALSEESHGAIHYEEPSEEVLPRKEVDAALLKDLIDG